MVYVTSKYKLRNVQCVICKQNQPRPSDRLAEMVWGLVPKEKRSGGRRNNTRAHSFEDIQRAVPFVSQYAEHHALVLPGRVPGFKRDDVKLLPSAESKAKVYGLYATTMKDSGMLIKSTYMHLKHEILINIQYVLHVYC